MARKDVLLCMNLQWNYFHEEGTSFLGRKASALHKGITDYLKGFDYESTAIFYTRDVRAPTDSFYKNQRTQCIVGTTDINMVEDLRYANSPVFTAIRPDATYRTKLLSAIKEQNPSEVTLIGAETQSSILMTAARLSTLGFNVKVIEPLVCSREDHLHNASISIMTEHYNIEVVSC